MDGAKLIAIHEGRYYRTSDGLSLGPGPFVKVLEYAAGVRATVVGKPSARFFQEALDGADPSSAVMIGDVRLSKYSMAMVVDGTSHKAYDGCRWNFINFFYLLVPINRLLPN